MNIDATLTDTIWSTDRMARKQLTPEGRAAKREYNRVWIAAWRKANPEAARAKYRAWAKAHPEQSHAWRKRHPEETRATKAAWHQANKQKQNQRSKAYYRLHAERMRTKNNEWRAGHLEEAKAAIKQWYSDHPEHSNNKRARRLSAPGRHTLADIEHLFEIQAGKCAGCKIGLRQKGKGRYHVDHVVPLVRGGSNDPGNLQLLCPPCNIRKNATDPYAWAKSVGRLFA